jgi:WD40 repeat protein
MPDSQADALTGQTQATQQKQPSEGEMLNQNHPISPFERFRENRTHLLFWLSPLCTLLALILFSLKWTNWEANLSGWQIALGPWGLDVIDFPHSLPAVWLVFWIIPFTALFLLSLAIARLFGFRLRWLRFWAVLLTAGCMIAIIIAKIQPNLEWNTEFSTANLNGLPTWTCALLILALCGLWVSIFPWEDPAQMTAQPARGRFSRRKALLNIGGLFVLGGASGYLFTLLQAQTQRAIAMRFQLNQPAYAIDPFGAGDNIAGFANIVGFAWSPDSKFMATINDYGLQIWQITPSLLRIKTILASSVKSGEFHFREVSWSPNGHLLAVLDEGSIDLYSAQTGQALAHGITPPGVNIGVGSVNWSPDGRSLASTLGDQTQALTFGTWEVSNAQNWRTFLNDRSDAPSGDAVDSLAWSPDGRMIATIDNHQITYRNTGVSTLPGGNSNLQATVTTSFSLWDVQSGERRYTYTLDAARDGAGTVSAIAWSPDGRSLALALAPSKYVEAHGQYTQVENTFTERCPLLIWNVTARKTVRSCWGNYGGLNSVTWSPDGTRVACGANNGTILFWNASTGALLLTYQGFSYRYSDASIQYLAWSPNGKLLAARGNSFSKDGVILVWNAPKL